MQLNAECGIQMSKKSNTVHLFFFFSAIPYRVPQAKIHARCLLYNRFEEEVMHSCLDFKVNTKMQAAF